MEKTARRCIFCGETRNLSKEHIFPDWLKDYIPKPPKARYYVHVKTLVALHPTPVFSFGRGKLDGRSGATISQTVKTVCRKCNNEWMSRLQDESRPILAPLVLGTWKPITEQEREILAKWITMFAMVADSSEPAQSAILQAQRSEFLLTKKPLPEWLIWIGEFDPGTKRLDAEIHRSRIMLGNQKTPGALVSINTQITSARMGRVVFQALSTTDMPLWKHVAFKFSPFQILTPIWPNFRGLSYKPTSVLRHGQLKALTHTLRDFIYRLNPKGSGPF